MKYDRDALIAYIYDLYCVEQALSLTNSALDVLYKKENEVKKELEDNIKKINENGQIAIKQREATYYSDTYSKEVRFKEHKKSIILSLAFICIYILGSYAMYKLLNTKIFAYGNLNSGIILIWLLFGGALIFASIVTYEKEEKMILKARERGTKKKNENRSNKIKNDITSIEDKVAQNIQDVSREAGNFTTQISSLIKKQKEQKDGLENLRYDLYRSQLLIPDPHQNLFSIAYIYRYLTTSKETNMKYIFTQLNFQKVLQVIEMIVKNQEIIITLQRRMLSELEKHTQILYSINANLSRINKNLSDFRSSVLNKLDEIGYDVSNINVYQKAILDNQSQYYKQMLEKAATQSRNQAETNAYLKMIDQHTKVSSFIQKAEFLGIDYNRSWYDIAQL